MSVVIGFALAGQLIANACRCSLNTQNFWVITTSFAAIRFRHLLPTLGVLMNTQGCRESWILSCISVHLSLPIAADMWNISTWSTQNFISHYCKWRTWPGREQHSTASGGEGALGGACSFLWSGRSVSLDVPSWQVSGYSAGSLTSIAKIVPFRLWKINDSTRVSSSHLSCHCP